MTYHALCVTYDIGGHIPDTPNLRAFQELCHCIALVVLETMLPRLCPLYTVPLYTNRSPILSIILCSIHDGSYNEERAARGSNGASQLENVNCMMEAPGMPPARAKQASTARRALELSERRRVRNLVQDL